MLFSISGLLKIPNLFIMLVISLCGVILDEFSKVLILSESFLNLFVLFVSLFTIFIKIKENLRRQLNSMKEVKKLQSDYSFVMLIACAKTKKSPHTRAFFDCNR